MLRRSLAACVLALVAGCQDYNFNPVGKCVIEPGASRLKVSSLATADILFVVDDSFSMNSKQQRLADNFTAFIDALAQTQKARTETGLVPLEFHIAITTSSVFEGQTNANTASTCSASGTPPTLQCSVPFPAFDWSAPYAYACTAAGSTCPDLVQSYVFGEFTNPQPPQGDGKLVCQPGVGADHAPYPKGNFVASGTNPRVLHFTKDLDWTTWGTATVDPKITALVQHFKDNIKVGTCGSSMEQHLEAAKLAVQKALAGQQQGVTTGEWPHPGAKLVIVWVGDEDDCSTPNDPFKALVFGASTPGNDVCTQDEAKPIGQQKLLLVQADASRPSEANYADFFEGLGRPFGAAFIYSTPSSTCKDDGKGGITCTPGTCTCTNSTDPQCGGFAPGNRFHTLSSAFKTAGSTTIEASVCDADFGTTLGRIAELVKPPTGLTLPSQPAASEVAVLRIEAADGSSSRQCTGPATDPDPGSADWWFVNCGDTTVPPAVSPTPTSCIYINHGTKHCEANPGETYIAQYLGLIPPPSAANPQGGCLTASDCQASLGGSAKDWSCAAQSAGARGTCVCGGGG